MIVCGRAGGAGVYGAQWQQSAIASYCATAASFVVE
jgi:hypothetical protein